MALIGGGIGLPGHTSLPAIADALNAFVPDAAERGLATEAALALGCARADVLLEDGVLVAVDGAPHGGESGQGAQRPAALVLALWRRHGFELARQLHGQFALAVLDTRARRALLAVDRLGIRPLAYLHEPASGRLLFGTRLELLETLAARRGSIDPQAVFDYLYAHMVPSPRCIYRDQRKLLPAQCLRLEDGRARLDFYWEAPYREDPGGGMDALAAELDARLEAATRRALPEAAFATFLSGGLDSSTVTGMAARLRPGQVEAYGIGFSAEGYDEMAYARATARHFGVRLHEYYVTPADVAATLPRMAEWYDEPFGNASAIPAFHCARVAREAGVEVMLAGDGGDEIFGGNARYAKQKIFGLYDALPGALRSALRALVFGLPGGASLAPLRKARSYIEQASVPLPDRLESYNFLHRSPLAEIFTPEFLASVDPGAPLGLAREVYGRARSDQALKRMLHLDLKITLADNDLRKVCRTAEAAGVQVRFPMLDEELVDFASRIPSPWLLKGLELRWFYKHALRNFLAPETLAKSKHGFGLPFGVWLRTDPTLHALAGDSLLALRGRGWLRPQYIDFLLERHESEHADYYGVMIWVLMALEQWLRHRGH